VAPQRVAAERNSKSTAFKLSEAGGNDDSVHCPRGSADSGEVHRKQCDGEPGGPHPSHRGYSGARQLDPASPNIRQYGTTCGLPDFSKLVSDRVRSRRANDPVQVYQDRCRWHFDLGRGKQSHVHRPYGRRRKRNRKLAVLIGQRRRLESSGLKCFKRTQKSGTTYRVESEPVEIRAATARLAGWLLEAPVRQPSRRLLNLSSTPCGSRMQCRRS